MSGVAKRGQCHFSYRFLCAGFRYTLLILLYYRNLWSICSCIYARVSSKSHWSQNIGWNIKVLAIISVRISTLSKFIPAYVESWNAWGEWSQCSATCDRGFRLRIRACSGSSNNCPGDPAEAEACKTTDCQGVFWKCDLIWCAKLTISFHHCKYHNVNFLQQCHTLSIVILAGLCVTYDHHFISKPHTDQ